MNVGKWIYKIIAQLNFINFRATVNIGCLKHEVTHEITVDIEGRTIFCLAAISGTVPPSNVAPNNESFQVVDLLDSDLGHLSVSIIQVDDLLGGSIIASKILIKMNDF